MVELARMFAVAFTCRTICDGSAYGDDDLPYWAVIWDAGRSFLADTCNTGFEDEAGGDARIVREISASDLNSMHRAVSLYNADEVLGQSGAR